MRPSRRRRPVRVAVEYPSVYRKDYERQVGLWERIPQRLPCSNKKCCTAPSSINQCPLTPFDINQLHVVCCPVTAGPDDFTSKELAGATGLETAASCVAGRRSNQLNYAPTWGKTITLLFLLSNALLLLLMSSKSLPFPLPFSAPVLNP